MTRRTYSKRAPQAEPLADRLARHSTRATSGCLEWTASLNAYGYGQLRWGGTPVAAHRLAWISRHGPIPKGLFVCHHCDNRKCIDIDHLFIGTPADNTADMIAKGRHVPPPHGAGDQHWRARLTGSAP